MTALQPRPSLLNKEPDEVLLKGYVNMAVYGGTALLIKAYVHRAGAMFPPFCIIPLMETGQGSGVVHCRAKFMRRFILMHSLCIQP